MVKEMNESVEASLSDSDTQPEDYVLQLKSPTKKFPNDNSLNGTIGASKYILHI